MVFKQVSPLLGPDTPPDVSKAAVACIIEQVSKGQTRQILYPGLKLSNITLRKHGRVDQASLAGFSGYMQGSDENDNLEVHPVEITGTGRRNNTRIKQNEG
jgi:hypothetical protein